MRNFCLQLAIFLLATAGAFLFFRGLPSTTEKNADKPRLLILAHEDWPPYSYLDGETPMGNSIEVVTAIFKRLGVPVEFRCYPHARALLMLQKGQAEGVMDISYSPDREELLYFTEAQKKNASADGNMNDCLWLSEYVLFAKKEKAESFRFESLEQLARTKAQIGINKGYSYTGRIKSAGLEHREYGTPAEAMRALAAGGIDFYLFEKGIGLETIKKTGLEKDLSEVEGTVFAKPYLFAFARSSKYPGLRELMPEFYAELNRMRANGELVTLSRRSPGNKVKRESPRPLVFVCEEWRPYEYLEDGRPAGLDVEVLEHIMKKLDIAYEIKFYPWSRAVLLTEKGMADAVLSVSYKDSREKLLYYTEEQREFQKSGKLPKDYLWISEYVFFIKKKNSSHIQFSTYEKLKEDGWRLGLNNNYTYAPDFPVGMPGAKKYASTEDGFRALLAGEIDLYPMDKLVGLATLRELGLQDSVSFIPKVLFSKPYLAPFSRLSTYPGLEQIMKDFYAELARMRDSGEYKEIYERHIMPLLPRED